MTYEHAVWTANKNWHNLTGTKQINLGCGISKSREEKELVFEITSSVNVKLTVITWHSRILNAIWGRSFLTSYWVVKCSVKLQECHFLHAGVHTWWGEGWHTQPQGCAVTSSSVNSISTHQLTEELTGERRKKIFYNFFF